MVRGAPSSPIPSTVHPFPQMRHRARRVLVRVVADGHELDRFEASDPDVLVAALRPIYAHLPERGAAVRFRGIEEEELPLGIDRVRREVDLAGLGSALAYLEALRGEVAPLSRAS